MLFDIKQKEHDCRQTNIEELVILMADINDRNIKTEHILKMFSLNHWIIRYSLAK